MACVLWSWQETQALLARLSQPTAAALDTEYNNIRSLTFFLNSDMLTTMVQLPPSQLDRMLRLWCSLAQPLLTVITQHAVEHHPLAMGSVGMLLSDLGLCLEEWLALKAKQEQPALKKQIAKQTAGLLPLLARVMAVTAGQLSKVTPEQRLKQEGAAAAVHVRDYFPGHPDIYLATYLLRCWTSLARILPGKLLRTSSSSSSSSSSKKAGSSRASSSSSSGGSSGLRESVVPACDLVVAVLNAWPPTLGGQSGSKTTSDSSSSSAPSPPDNYMARSSITSLTYALSEQLLNAIYLELLMDDSPCSSSDARLVDQLTQSAAVQHLLLICIASACHQRHQELQGVSPIKVKTAAAVVSASASLAAAAAAAEASGADQQQQEPRYLTVPAHHVAVLELLLTPAIDFDPVADGRSKAAHLVYALRATVEFLLAMQPNSTISSSSSSGKSKPLGKVTALPKLPVELCAPLHALLAEAAALIPESLPGVHMALVFTLTLQDVYFEAKVSQPATPAVVTAALRAYKGALPASLQLMGPAVLHGYKYGKDGDLLLPAGGGGCPVGPDGMPLKGAKMRDALVNLFGSTTVKICAPGILDVLTGAFRRAPFTAAAVCEAAVRGAARHNMMHPGAIRMFAGLATAACQEAAAPASSSSSSSSSLVEAAVSVSATRPALLLQCSLITSQLKYTIGSGNGVNTLGGLFQQVGPTARTVLQLAKLLEASIGMDSSKSIGGPDKTGSDCGGSSSATDTYTDTDRVAVMTPWFALAGRCLYVAGAQLLVAMESPTAAAAPALSPSALTAMQEVLTALCGCSLVVGAQIHQLQVLQPQACVMLGPTSGGYEALELLLEQLATATKLLENSMKNWRAASAVVALAVAANGGIGMAWGHKLQKQLRACLGSQAAAAIRDAGAAVVAEFPVRSCCNHPGCSNMAKLGEMQLGQCCSGCKAAKYCGKECQTSHWKMGHKEVCKRVKAAAAAAGGTPAAQ